jgi:hypothetical protein
MLAIKPLCPAAGWRPAGRVVGPFRLGLGNFFSFSAVFSRLGVTVFAEISAGVSVAHGALIKKWGTR